MTIRKIPIPFENRMTKTQTILGWIYTVLHIALLPLLLSLLAVSVPGMTEGQVNVLYYGVGVLFTAAVMLPFLRSSFDVLLDRLRFCIICILLALLVEYALRTACTLVLMLLQSLPEANPATETMLELAESNSGILAGLSVFLAPVIEEILFRGVVFGSIRSRSRGWAYVVSIVLFSVYHVWQYAAVSGDLRYLLYSLSYVPAAAALAWAYEHSGSIWTSIFFHMGFNALSFTVLNLMERL